LSCNYELVYDPFASTTYGSDIWAIIEKSESQNGAPKSKAQRDKLSLYYAEWKRTRFRVRNTGSGEQGTLSVVSN
jgi:hypothetical protein